MVTAEQLAARRSAIAASADLQGLVASLATRWAPLAARPPVIPTVKALLSSDGGVCPADGAPLIFDPWSAEEHRCPRCDQTWRGERHDRHWARYQHLWLAERAAHGAALAVLCDDAAAGARAGEILAAYAARYWQFPNRDNVLGPSRLFFSTYLESLWLSSYLGAAHLLRAAGRLGGEQADAVTQVADEAANLIGEFDEWFSNRQTWNNAALTALAVWFEDHDLMERAVGGQTGLVAHLLEGFRPDGMWYEGENYHLFALRGLLTGITWARAGGVDLLEHAPLAERLEAALLAPARTALPDFTFPARKDSRFGVSLAQPMYLEGWEVGLGLLGTREAGSGMRELGAWLSALYQTPGSVPQTFESYLHDAPVSVPRPPSRASLSWWSLVFMAPELPAADAPWRPQSALLPSQGLAVLRTPPDRYVSLECGPTGGGHGHPDRLHLTVHAGGVHWLRDFGTGSYVAPDLQWYRSTLAHNAPRLDGVDQTLTPASCEAFETRDDWAWARGRWGDVRRTVVSGGDYVVDLVEVVGREDRSVAIPWHVAGGADVRTPGRWVATELAGAGEFVTGVERFVPDGVAPLRLEAGGGGGRLGVHLVSSGTLLRASAPGVPGSDRRETFYVVAAAGRNLRLLAVLDYAPAEVVRGVRITGEQIDVETGQGVERHRIEGDGWSVDARGKKVRLGGRRSAEPSFTPMLQLDHPEPATGVALRLDGPPALDGSLDGFDQSEPLLLELEDQYRRSEEPFSGVEDFSARAYAAWDEEALYLAVDVTKPDLCFRAPDAPPAKLDNEIDDIHSDGLQVYLREPGGASFGGWLVVPEERSGGLRVHAVRGTDAAATTVRGRWARRDGGYVVTLALAWPEWQRAHVGGQVGFDLIVNEMLPGRERRAGQLAWSGGNGWVWLRGDRQDPDRVGVLELVG